MVTDKNQPLYVSFIEFETSLDEIIEILIQRKATLAQQCYFKFIISELIN